MGRFLLLSVFVLGTVPATHADSSAAALNGAVVRPAPPGIQDEQPPNALNQNQFEYRSDPARSCLHIHAFIFETNDDRVPKLVGETTCMPANARMERVYEFKGPRLVPAAGGK